MYNYNAISKYGIYQKAFNIDFGNNAVMTLSRKLFEEIETLHSVFLVKQGCGRDCIRRIVIFVFRILYSAFCTPYSAFCMLYYVCTSRQIWNASLCPSFNPLLIIDDKTVPTFSVEFDGSEVLFRSDVILLANYKEDSVLCFYGNNVEMETWIQLIGEKDRERQW